ncbi:hypothetical protein D3C81_735810 [compost metagenome]
MPAASLGSTINDTTQTKATGVSTAKNFDHLMRRLATIARLCSILASVASGSGCCVPRAISALSKVPVASMAVSTPVARACQRSSSAPLAGTMWRRIDR